MSHNTELMFSFIEPLAVFAVKYDCAKAILHISLECSIDLSNASMPLSPSNESQNAERSLSSHGTPLADPTNTMHLSYDVKVPTCASLQHLNLWTPPSPILQFL